MVKNLAVILLLCLIFTISFFTFQCSPATNLDHDYSPDVSPNHHNQYPPIGGIIDTVKCVVCKLAAFEMHRVYSKNATKQCVAAILTDMCAFLELEDTAVCGSLIHEFTVEDFLCFIHMYCTSTYVIK